jgi:hypothetical protein
MLIGRQGNAQHEGSQSVQLASLSTLRSMGTAPLEADLVLLADGMDEATQLALRS